MQQYFVTSTIFFFLLSLLFTMYSLAELLAEHQLTSSNYFNWRKNLEFVLDCEGVGFVLTNPCPYVFAPNTSEDTINKFNTWCFANNMAINIVLFSLSPEFRRLYDTYPTASDIVNSIADMFEPQNRPLRSLAIFWIMNSRFEDGSSVHDHVRGMMASLEEFKILGGFIDPTSQVDIILNSLPDSFHEFKTCMMSKAKCNIVDLVTELQKRGESLQRVGTVSEDTIASSSGEGKEKIVEVPEDTPKGSDERQDVDRFTGIYYKRRKRRKTSNS